MAGPVHSATGIMASAAPVTSPAMRIMRFPLATLPTLLTPFENVHDILIKLGRDAQALHIRNRPRGQPP
jgi:hypothetical protein